MPAASDSQKYLDRLGVECQASGHARHPPPHPCLAGSSASKVPDCRNHSGGRKQAGQLIPGTAKLPDKWKNWQFSFQNKEAKPALGLSAMPDAHLARLAEGVNTKVGLPKK